MSQPVWKAIAQIGDRNPLDHGGQWVLHDETGVYPDEIECLQVPDEDNDKSPRTVIRFILEKCTFVDGILSDNKFHPEHPAWFGNLITEISSTPEAMIESLCSDDPVTRALAYVSMAEHFGFNEFDHCPIQLSKAECKNRYKNSQYQCDGWKTIRR
jgi:hypothetical protein